ncbi:YcjX family protein [Frigoriglobus tundricola]|uniref:Amino acid regulated cytosolic protein n=1 Tax=Frigoriglobus tundricola TaxID=2774151 RepID=A0A6M5Z1C5_9BACT|nr:YcjX family protein [Frigoriglobus tundricola]QJW99968.1 Amino acid regulated cytosolic protein [Frigoriglobus tundricola]
MSMLRVKTTEARVGVVGLYSSGKTVLLTSLINHLQDHDPDRFPLGKPGTRLRRFTAKDPDRGWAPFNYFGHRDALVNYGRWPSKTTDRAQFVCQFERSDWTFSDCLLKLYDLPGERIADASMLGRDFTGWSERMLNLFLNDTTYRTHTAPFLEAIKNPGATEAELLSAYRLSLANLILNFKPLITPSTFLLDLKGQPARPMAPADLAVARHCGLDADTQFCPLPADRRTPGTDPFDAFSTRYGQYVEQVVVPTVAAFRSCTALVVLVDVTMLLAGGVGMYDDNRQIVKDLFEVLSPGENKVFGPVARGLSKVFLPHQWRPGWITRVAFCAPKMDLVHPLDRDRMQALMRRMVERFATDRDGLRHEFFNVSSVVSTRALPAEPGGPRVLVGTPLRGADGRKVPPAEEKRFTASDLPDDWPLEWPAGRYAFPEVYPKMPARKDYPPDQVNLDKLATFVIE